MKYKLMRLWAILTGGHLVCLLYYSGTESIRIAYYKKLHFDEQEKMLYVGSIWSIEPFCGLCKDGTVIGSPIIKAWKFI